MSMNAEFAFFLFQNAVAPFQILFDINRLVFTVFTAIPPDKTRQSHSPIRVNLPKEEAVQREIEHTTQKAVATIGLRNAIAMSKIHAFALNFKDNGFVDGNT